MSVYSSKFTISDVAGVNAAVQHVLDLGSRMKNNEFTFKETDLHSIDGIVEALKELQLERAHVHDNLEVETINASILRHQLQILPGKIRKEITAAVASARESNAAELTRLQEKLRAINENIEYLEKRHHELEQENAQLHPDRDKVRKEHEDIIVQLNQRMAEKASKQIFLNETRDKLRTTNQKIVDLEDSIMQLKEDLVQERADARMEKRRLKKAVYDTTLKTREQKEANVAKKKEVDHLHEKVLESEHALDNIRKTMRRYETSRSRMEGQERALKQQLNKEIQNNQELKVIGEEIAQQTIIEEAEWQDKKIGLDDAITELDLKIGKQEERHTELAERHEKLTTELQGKMKIKRADEKRVRDTNMRLQSMKGELADKAENVGELSQENIDMEAKIEEIAEQHKSIMSTMAKQIEEAREQLSRERKDRMDQQVKRDSVTRAVDDVKTEANRFVADMNRRIREGKDEHDKLTKEGTSLQKNIRADDDRIKELKLNLQTKKTDFKNMEEECEREITLLNEEIAAMQRELEENGEKLEQRQPDFQVLEVEFEEMNKEYDVVKKGIVAKKNLKMGLEDHVKRAKMQIEKMTNPRARITAENKKLREQILDQMRAQGAEVRDIEEKVYVVGCKLKTVLEENERFTSSNSKMTKDIVNMHEEMQINLRLMETLQGQDQELRLALTADWDEDRLMQEQFAAKDMLLVESLGTLLNRTEKREGLISNITDKLQSELGMLTTFLDNVAAHRPPEEADEEKAAKAKLKDPLAMVADANPAPPTPSHYSTSPQPHIHPVIPPIKPSPRLANNQPPSSRRGKLQPTPRRSMNKK